MTLTNETESWGDDELIAEDVSAIMLLQRANLTTFFNDLNFPGSYPTLLYFSDEAEALNDRIFAEIGKSQAPEADPKFVIRVRTAFKGEKEQTAGKVYADFYGAEAFSAELRPHILTLMRSGIKNWLEAAYSTHGKTASIKWLRHTETDSEGTITGK